MSKSTKSTKSTRSTQSLAPVIDVRKMAADVSSTMGTIIKGREEIEKLRGIVINRFDYLNKLITQIADSGVEFGAVSEPPRMEAGKDYIIPDTNLGNMLAMSFVSMGYEAGTAKNYAMLVRFCVENRTTMIEGCPINYSLYQKQAKEKGVPRLDAPEKKKILAIKGKKWVEVKKPVKVAGKTDAGKTDAGKPDDGVQVVNAKSGKSFIDNILQAITDNVTFGKVLVAYNAKLEAGVINGNDRNECFEAYLEALVDMKLITRNGKKVSKTI